MPILDEKFWLAVSFVIFVALVWKPIARFVLKALDDRSEAIRNELEEAVRLREEAQAVLAAYQKKQRESLKEAEEILRKTKEEAQHLQSKAEANLKKSLDDRMKLAVEKIAQAEAKALEDVQHNMVDMAISAARLIIQEQVGKTSGQEQIRAAMADIERKIH